MTELEKIEYAKSFIDRLANGINPLDDTPIPEDDLANHVRLSRCFFYVSSILQKEIDRERRKLPKPPKQGKTPFSITQEQLQRFEYSPYPITVPAMGKKINWLVRDEIEEKRMEKFSYRKIHDWLHDIGMIAWREWLGEKKKRFPTAEGEAIGLELRIWENYGRKAPVIYLTEEAQHFIIDHMDAVMAAEKGSPPPLMDEAEETEEENLERIPKKHTKPNQSFSLTQEQREDFPFSEEPISVSEIARRINGMADNENMKRLSRMQITQWLSDEGMLCLYDSDGGKTVKLPTETGYQIGMTVESRENRNEEYQIVLYNKEAQRIILDNLDAIAATEVKKGTKDGTKREPPVDKGGIVQKDRDSFMPIRVQKNETDPEEMKRLCRNCRFQVSGECSSWEPCDEFQPAYRVPQSEMENWPTEGDATRFRQKWQKR